jgi:Gpi18-like mannosyltransferase
MRRIPSGTPKLHGREGFSVSLFPMLLAVGLVLRLILGYCINGFDADIACFKAWACYTHEVGFNGMYYSDFFIDYPPGYLYMLYVTEFFRRLFSIPDYSQTFTLLIKLIPILSDISCTAILWVLARRRLSENAALFTASAYLFCPAVIINSAVWGQADSFCALLLLLTVLLSLN